MQPRRILASIQKVTEATGELEALLRELQAEHDPLAAHIFVSRRHYHTMSDTKSGKRHQAAAMSSFREAIELGYRGNLGEWARLLGATAAH